MMNEPTIDKLHRLRLAAMAEAWTQQNKIPKVADLGFDERFAMLVDAEYLARGNLRLTRLLKDAQLRLNNACVEDIEASPARGIDKATLRQLGTCGWLTEHLNVLLCGPTDVGKSYLACPSGRLQACSSLRRSSTGSANALTSPDHRSPTRRMTACRLVSRMYHGDVQSK